MFRFSPHIAVNVKDYEQAVKFYRDVLGFEQIKQGKKETHFKNGGLNFYMEGDAELRARLVFFEFEVDDIEVAEKMLLDQGCSITSVYGEKSKMFSDPYGLNFHVFEKGTNLPGVQ